MAGDDQGALTVGDGSAAAACDDEQGERRSLVERAASLTSIREGVANDSAMDLCSGSMWSCTKMMKCIQSISFTSWESGLTLSMWEAMVVAVEEKLVLKKGRREKAIDGVGTKLLPGDHAEDGGLDSSMTFTSALVRLMAEGGEMTSVLVGLPPWTAQTRGRLLLAAIW